VRLRLSLRAQGAIDLVAVLVVGWGGIVQYVCFCIAVCGCGYFGDEVVDVFDGLSEFGDVGVVLNLFKSIEKML